MINPHVTTNRLLRLIIIFLLVFAACITVEGIFAKHAYASSSAPCAPITYTRINLEIDETLDACQTKLYLDGIDSSQQMATLIAAPLCIAGILACAEIEGLLNVAITAKKDQIQTALDSCYPQTGVVMRISIALDMQLIGIRGNC
jgi:hypothetical protein